MHAKYVSHITWKYHVILKKNNLVITTSNAYMDFIPYFKAEATSFDQEIIGETVFSLSSHLEIL